jgi:hypothetical protein
MVSVSDLRSVVARALAAGLCAALAAPAAAVDAPGTPASLFEVYAENRRQGIPNYVTEDFLLVSYSMMVADAAIASEEARSTREVATLVDGLLEKVRAAPDDDARRGNLEFLSVLRALRDDGGPQDLSPAVQEELARVRAAKGLAFSQVARQTLDYGQFRPRGDYTRSDTLKRYFQVVRYAGSVLFPLKESAATGITAEDADRLTRQAIVVSGLVKGDPQLAAAHAALEERFAWLFGPAEDLTVDDYAGRAAEVGRTPMASLRAALFGAAREAGRRPSVLSGLLAVEKLEPGLEAADVLTGWRLFPQRATPDAAALQQLVYGSVGAYRGTGTPSTRASIDGKLVKGFPMGLELLALLGSTASARRLDAADERNYEGYADAAARAKQALLAGRGRSAGEIALMGYWAGQAGPDAAAEERRANTLLGFWTWQRHTSVLHAKQSYTAVARGLGPPPRTVAWLEPAEGLYSRLKGLADEGAQRLDSAGLARLSKVLERCVELSRGGAAGAVASGDDAAFLNGLDAELAALISRSDGPIVVDVHTEPNSRQVLEEALGFPRLVEKPLPGQGTARGGLFNHTEFKQPMDGRLDDEAWLARLQSGSAGQEVVR